MKLVIAPAIDDRRLEALRAAAPQLGQRVVSAVTWVDGTLIDCVRQAG